MMNDNIKVKVPMTRAEMIGYVLGAAAIIYAVVLIFAVFMPLPQAVSFMGEDYADKNLMLIFPGAGFLCYIMMVIFMRFPHMMNYSVKITENNAARVYSVAKSCFSCMNAAGTWLFTMMFFAFLKEAQGEGGYLAPIVIFFAGLSIASYVAMFVLVRKAAKEEA